MGYSGSFVAALLLLSATPGMLLRTREGDLLPTWGGGELHMPPKSP